MSFYLTEAQTKKWAPILDDPSFPAIKDSYRRDVTGMLLENTQKNFLTEAVPSTSITTGGIENWEPVLINLVRRSMPTLAAYDICSVQPMNGPVGQIFAMKSVYSSDGAEALFNDARTYYAGKGQGGVGTVGTDVVNDIFQTGSGSDIVSHEHYNPGTGLDTYDTDGTINGYGANNDASTNNAENWGSGPSFGEMSFTIDRSTVTAKSRALKAEYSVELEQDLKQMRGMSVEAELINILTSEITLEINREILYTAIKAATMGMQSKTATSGRGIFNADTDSDGRWSVEKWKGLMFHIEREANAIARTTRRGKANFIVCSSDVASALAMAQILDYTPALQNNLEVNDAGNIFAGTLAGRYKVYIDPYWTGDYDYVMIGYKGTSAYDAGMFYCPYIPIEMYRAISPTTFQPSIGFKTRYGIVANPFTSLSAGTNTYMRKFKVTNLI